MRKVSRVVAESFLAGQSKSIGNTSTDGKTLQLHGNTIATRIDSNTIELTLAGWPTVTTRERLNAICELAASIRPFCQSSGLQWVNGLPIHPSSSVLLNTTTGEIYS